MHKGSQIALRRVVRRFDATTVYESPEGLAVRKDVRADSTEAPFLVARTAFQKPLHSGSDWDHPILELATGHGAVADLVPFVEHDLSGRLEFPGNVATRSTPLGTASELSKQVCPTYLT